MSDASRPPPPAEILEGIRAVIAKMDIETANTSETTDTVLGLDPDIRIAEDLGLDSMRRIEFAIKVENRFRIILEPEDEAQIETLGDLCRVIEARRGGADDA